MSYSLDYVKQLKNAIFLVNRVNNKLLFYQASNLLVPKRVILTQNLKSINVINFPLVPGMVEARYTTEFYYHNDTKVDSLDWCYAALNQNWEKETIQLINKTIELV